MPPWTAAWIAATVLLIVIRVPHVRRSTKIKVKKSRIGPREVLPIVGVGIGLLLPLVWLLTSFPACADRPRTPLPFAAGLLAYALGLWLLYRTHADLGTNWSNTLQVRENHTLVTNGSYRRVRHPMYTALFLYAIGQALVVPNLVAGPAFLMAFTLLIALRLGPEERLMREEFGPAYDAYAAHTWRLVPGVW